MDEIDDEDYAKAINKIYNDYFSKQSGIKTYQKKSKTISHLLSKGYEYDVILDVLENE